MDPARRTRRVVAAPRRCPPGCPPPRQRSGGSRGFESASWRSATSRTTASSRSSASTTGRRPAATLSGPARMVARLPDRRAEPDADSQRDQRSRPRAPRRSTASGWTIPSCSGTVAYIIEVGWWEMQNRKPPGCALTCRRAASSSSTTSRWPASATVFAGMRRRLGYFKAEHQARAARRAVLRDVAARSHLSLVLRDQSSRRVPQAYNAGQPVFAACTKTTTAQPAPDHHQLQHRHLAVWEWSGRGWGRLTTPTELQARRQLHHVRDDAWNKRGRSRQTWEGLHYVQTGREMEPALEGNVAFVEASGAVVIASWYTDRAPAEAAASCESSRRCRCPTRRSRRRTVAAGGSSPRRRGAAAKAARRIPGSAGVLPCHGSSSGRATRTSRSKSGCPQQNWNGDLQPAAAALPAAHRLHG